MLRGGIRRFDLDVFATQASGEAGHSLLIAHPRQLQAGLGLARPPMQHTANEIAAAAERKLWPAPLTLKEFLAWMGTTGAGQQVESITLEPKRDLTLPEFVFDKLLDDVLAAPGIDSRTTVILSSVRHYNLQLRASSRLVPNAPVRCNRHLPRQRLMSSCTIEHWATAAVIIGGDDRCCCRTIATASASPAYHGHARFRAAWLGDAWPRARVCSERS